MSPFTHIDTIETPEANLRPPPRERKMYFYLQISFNKSSATALSSILIMSLPN